MTFALVIATWVAIGVLVAALAAYLLTIIVLLRRIHRTAGLILFGVRAIAEQASPIGEALRDVNGELAAARDALQSLAAKAAPARASEATEESPAAASSGMRGVVQSVVERAREIAGGESSDA